MGHETIYILGGDQTDFATNASRQGQGLFELLQDAVQGALNNAGVEAQEVQAGHIGNFVGELFTGQGQLGGKVAAIDPAFHGMPAGRHEAACASGSIAALAATAEIQAQRYDCVLVAGVELERNVPGAVAARHLGAATWVGEEAQDVPYAWPHMFHRVGLEYERRYGLKYEHLGRIAEINLTNARRNPKAQTRDWVYGPRSFLDDDEAYPVIDGMIRRPDCGQVTDGAAAVVLASERFAARWAARHQRSLDSIPRIAGWGHRTAPLKPVVKLQASAQNP